MKIFIKYFLGLLVLGVVIIFYFLKTNSGHQNLGYFVEDYLSTQTYNKIKIYSLNLEEYPHIVIELQLNNTSDITLKGVISNHDINMSYHLRGEALSFNDFHLKDKIDVHGELFGLFSSLRITGRGEIFEGVVDYSFINIPHKIKEMHIRLKKVNIDKIFGFLEERAFIGGFANIDVDFDCFSKYTKEGQIKVDIPHAFIPKIEEKTPFILSSTIDFKGVELGYKVDIHSNIGEVIFRDGYYHDGEKIVKGDYEVHLKDLAYLNRMFNQNYEGVLNLKGTLIYDIGSGVMEINGHTEQFGGEVSYVYKNEHFDMKLKDVSLERLLKQFSYPILFVSKINGVVHFNIQEKSVIVNTELNETRFVRSQLSKILYDKAEIDILTEVYDQSSFRAGYQNSRFSSTLKIDNAKSHIYLTDSTFNIINDKIDSNFEIKLQGQEIYGEIHGTLKEPKIWIDKKKIMEYQMNKHLGAWLGTTK